MLPTISFIPRGKDVSMTLFQILFWDRNLLQVWKHVSSTAGEIYQSSTVTVSWYYDTLIYFKETKKILLLNVY